MLLRSNFTSFPQYLQYISNFTSQITYSFAKCGCSIYFFLNSANLICQCMDISKYLESLFDFQIARANCNNLLSKFTVESPLQNWSYHFWIGFSTAFILTSRTNRLQKTEKTQIRCCRMWQLIWVFNVCHSPSRCKTCHHINKLTCSSFGTRMVLSNYLG